MTKAGPARGISKSKFAMYLRTKCDRELYLSLFSNNPKALAAAGIPIPLKSRPGVQIITTSGHEFEADQYDLLISSIPGRVLHNSRGRASIDPSAALGATTQPCLILQPQIEPEEFRSVAFANIGVSTTAQALIPTLSGLRPDVLLVREAGSAKYEILPDGSRRPIAPDDDRLPISVIDLKNITEANATYSAEVCLYAFFLANWLAQEGSPLSDRYFVSDQIYLWRHVEMPRFNKARKTKDGGSEPKVFAALLEDLDDGLVNYLVYMPSVRKFFVEDVPRVVELGDSQGWDSVPYHVNPRCGSCDWLGNKSWLSPVDKKVFEAHPQHYCFQNAEASDHLSKIPVLSRGAATVLSDDGHARVKDLVGIAPGSPTLRKHTILKRDRRSLGTRADSLTSDTVLVDPDSRIGGVARNWNAEFDIIVNFDVGAGLLTGIALRAVLSAPFGEKFEGGNTQASGLHFLGEESFVVPGDNPAGEWAALSAFIERLGEWVDKAASMFEDRNWGRVRTQICFWEARQYEELCNAFGRHLLDVLGLAEKTQRALAWVFPAERLMERDDAVCPSIVFIREALVSSVCLPQRFATTLLGTAEFYGHPKLPPRKIDNYYREPLGNAIPRERIFDIWKSTTGTVRLFGKVVSIADAIERYGRVLKAHAWALGSVTARLRQDLKAGLDARAPFLPMSIPSGMRSVALDSKLWMQWTDVSSAAAETEARLAFVTSPEALEASYKAILIGELVTDHGGHTYTCEVSDDSTEAKIEEGDKYCTIGVATEPGLALQTPSSLGLPLLSTDPAWYVPIHRMVAVSVLEFDRVNRRITIAFRPRTLVFNTAVNALLTRFPVGSAPLYLVEGLPPDDTESTRRILAAIGNPPCSFPAPEALEALGRAAAKKLPRGKDPETPVARILWTPVSLNAGPARSRGEADALAEFARTANRFPLNASQLNAVRACALQALTIVWGPPGTGKTDTLVAFLHATVREARRRKILVTGPNYRTVEEIASRFAQNLSKDTSAATDFFWVYSRNRDLPTPPSTGTHVNLKAIKLVPGAPDTQELADSIKLSTRTTIVATTAHIAHKFTPLVAENPDLVLDEMFDLVVLDESSQIQVTLALRPLSALKSDGQVIVAGDHLQMPPIHQLEPPANAEHLVGSIQRYLIERFGFPREELLVNYRSNRDLVDYAKTLGYPAALIASEPAKQLQLIRPLDQVIAGLPTHLPTTDAYQLALDPAKRVVALIHDDLVSSQANEVEAGLVAALAFCIRNAFARELTKAGGGTTSAFDDDFFFDQGVGIVTPHKAQKALVVRSLLQCFPKADPSKIYGAVDTVERFQGGERQAILVSFGVGDTDVIEGEEAFLLQMERTNVAVSRAMAKCIVLMPRSLAYHLPTDQKAAGTSMAIKSYIEEFCGHREPKTINFAGAQRAAEVRWH